MATAFSVFINGISGVFTGIAVLYVLMKLLAIAAPRSTADPTPPKPTTR